jgi:hypothetical protein
MLSKKVLDVIRLSAQIVVGTTVYTLIVVLASTVPAAAGLMLTFPALNGLGFFFSRQENIEAMAQTMLWMPLLNGALCAAYMLLFLVLGRIDGSPTSVAWVLMVAMTLVWFACVTRNKVSAGIPHDRQLAYGVATSAVGALLVAVVYVISSPESVASRANTMASADKKRRLSARRPVREAAYA